MQLTKLTKNFLYNLSYEVLLYSVPFITTPYLSRVLGAEGIGRYSFAQSIVSYFVLVATLGTALYGQKKIAASKNQPQKAESLFWEIFDLRLLTTFVMAVIYCAVILPLCNDVLLYIIAAIELVTVGFNISWFFQGQENFRVITLTNGLCKFIGVILIFIFVKDRADLNKYVLIFCGSALMGYLLQWPYVKRYFSLKSFWPMRTVQSVQHHFYPAISLFVAEVAIQVYTVLDKTMIGVITHSDAQNGYYEQAQKLIKVLVALTTAIGPVMASRVANLWKENKQGEIQSLLLNSFRLTFSLGFPVMFGIILIAARFVPIFYGSGYDAIIPLLWVLSPLIIIIGCSNVIGRQCLVPTGRERFLTRSVMAGAVSNIILNAVLIPHYQALGASVASVIAELFVTAIQIYCVRREIPVFAVIKMGIHYIVLSVPMVILGITVLQIAPQGILGLVIIAFTCALFYFGELLLTKDKLFSTLMAPRQ